MDRVLQGVGGPITVTFSVAGTPTDPAPDTATVRVVNDAGTELVPTTGAVNAGTGVFSYDLTGTAVAELDRLTAYWTVTFGGVARTAKTTVEVVGGFLFTIAQARTALGDNTYDAAKIVEARTYAETEIEKALGFALVPRYARESFSAVSRSPIRLRPYVRAVRSLSVAGTAISAGDLAALTYTGGGFLYGYSWPTGYSNVLVGYEHGLDVGNDLLPGAQRAALAVAIQELGGGSSAAASGAERLITDDGTLVFGGAGGSFADPNVNRWVASNRLLAVA